MKVRYYAERYNLSELLSTTVIEQYMVEHGEGFSISLSG